MVGFFKPKPKVFDLYLHGCKIWKDLERFLVGSFQYSKDLHKVLERPFKGCQRCLVFEDYKYPKIFIKI